MRGEAIKSIIHTLGPTACKHHLLLFPFLGLLFLLFNRKCPWHEGTLMAHKDIAQRVWSPYKGNLKEVPDSFCRASMVPCSSHPKCLNYQIMPLLAFFAPTTISEACINKGFFARVT